MGRMIKSFEIDCAMNDRIKEVKEYYGMRSDSEVLRMAVTHFLRVFDREAKKEESA